MTKTAIIHCGAADLGRTVHAAMAAALLDDGVSAITLQAQPGTVVPGLFDPETYAVGTVDPQLLIYSEGAVEFERRLKVVADGPPDRISIERKSPFYDQTVENLGVRIDGTEQDSVVEYCVSEKWARIGERDLRGKLIWKYDHYETRMLKDVAVEPYWKTPLSRQQRRARDARMRKGRSR